jgi:hypothetical protein
MVICYVWSGIVISNAGIGEAWSPFVAEKFHIKTHTLLKRNGVQDVPAEVSDKTSVSRTVISGLTAIGKKEYIR